MKRWKKAWLPTLCLTLALCLVPALAADGQSPTTGSCGDNATWSYDAESKTLTISGTGEFEPITEKTAKQAQNVVIEDGITAVPSMAFADYGSFTQVTLPDSVTKVGEKAFFYCDSLKEITLPDSVTQIGKETFSHCISLEKIMLPDSVTQIGEGAFSNCISLEEVTLPDSVTQIGKRAFYYCKSLEKVTLPSRLTRIEAGTFEECKLKSIVLPAGITSIGDRAFFNCEHLETIEFPDGLQGIGHEAFTWCKLSQINLPASLVRIGNAAFSSCAALNDIRVAEENPIYKVEDGMLVDTDSKTLVLCEKDKVIAEIPEDVTEIGEGAFLDCALLTDIVWTKNVNSIGDYAFGRCTSLTSVEIPEGVERYGIKTFFDCTNLKELRVLSEWTFPNLGIEDQLMIVRMGEGVTSLRGTFSGFTSMTTVYLPASLTEIGENSFKDCHNLKTVYFAGTEAQWQAVTIAIRNPELSLATVICTGTEPDPDPDKPEPTPDPDTPNELELTVADGGIGKRMSAQITAGHWLTVQVRRGDSISIMMLQAEGTGEVSVKFSAPLGSSVQVWETAEEIEFADDMPVTHILAKASTQL